MILFLAMRVPFRTKQIQHLTKTKKAADDVLKQERSRSRLNTVY